MAPPHSAAPSATPPLLPPSTSSTSSSRAPSARLSGAPQSRQRRASTLSYARRASSALSGRDPPPPPALAFLLLLLHRFPLLTGMNPESLEELSHLARRMRTQRRDALAREGDAATSVFLIESGEYRLSKVSAVYDAAQGRHLELTVAVLGSGEEVGAYPLIAVALDHVARARADAERGARTPPPVFPVHPLSVTCAAPGAVFAVPIGALFAVLTSRPSLLRHLTTDVLVHHAVHLRRFEGAERYKRAQAEASGAAASPDAMEEERPPLVYNAGRGAHLRRPRYHTEQPQPRGVQWEGELKEGGEAHAAEALRAEAEQRRAKRRAARAAREERRRTMATSGLGADGQHRTEEQHRFALQAQRVWQAGVQSQKQRARAEEDVRRRWQADAELAPADGDGDGDEERQLERAMDQWLEQRQRKLTQREQQQQPLMDRLSQLPAVASHPQDADICDDERHGSGRVTVTAAVDDAVAFPSIAVQLAHISPTNGVFPRSAADGAAHGRQSVLGSTIALIREVAEEHALSHIMHPKAQHRGRGRRGERLQPRVVKWTDEGKEDAGHRVQADARELEEEDERLRRSSSYYHRRSRSHAHAKRSAASPEQRTRLQSAGRGSGDDGDGPPLSSADLSDRADTENAALDGADELSLGGSDGLTQPHLVYSPASNQPFSPTLPDGSINPQLIHSIRSGLDVFRLDGASAPPFPPSPPSVEPFSAASFLHALDEDDWGGREADALDAGAAPGDTAAEAREAERAWGRDSLSLLRLGSKSLAGSAGSEAQFRAMRERRQSALQAAMEREARALSASGAGRRPTLSNPPAEPSFFLTNESHLDQGATAYTEDPLALAALLSGQSISDQLMGSSASQQHLQEAIATCQAQRDEVQRAGEGERLSVRELLDRLYAHHGLTGAREVVDVMVRERIGAEGQAALDHAAATRGLLSLKLQRDLSAAVADVNAEMRRVEQLRAAWRNAVDAEKEEKDDDRRKRDERDQRRAKREEERRAKLREMEERLTREVRQQLSVKAATPRPDAAAEPQPPSQRAVRPAEPPAPSTAARVVEEPSAPAAALSDSVPERPPPTERSESDEDAATESGLTDASVDSPRSTDAADDVSTEAESMAAVRRPIAAATAATLSMSMSMPPPLREGDAPVDGRTTAPPQSITAEHSGLIEESPSARALSSRGSSPRPPPFIPPPLKQSECAPESVATTPSLPSLPASAAPASEADIGEGAASPALPWSLDVPVESPARQQTAPERLLTTPRTDGDGDSAGEERAKAASTPGSHRAGVVGVQVTLQPPPRSGRAKVGADRTAAVQRTSDAPRERSPAPLNAPQPHPLPSPSKATQRVAPLSPETVATVAVASAGMMLEVDSAEHASSNDGESSASAASSRSTASAEAAVPEPSDSDSDASPRTATLSLGCDGRADRVAAPPHDEREAAQLPDVLAATTAGEELIDTGPLSRREDAGAVDVERGRQQRMESAGQRGGTDRRVRQREAGSTGETLAAAQDRRPRARQRREARTEAAGPQQPPRAKVGQKETRARGATGASPVEATAGPTAGQRAKKASATGREGAAVQPSRRQKRLAVAQQAQGAPPATAPSTMAPGDSLIPEAVTQSSAQPQPEESAELSGLVLQVGLPSDDGVPADGLKRRIVEELQVLFGDEVRHRLLVKAMASAAESLEAKRAARAAARARARRPKRTVDHTAIRPVAPPPPAAEANMAEGGMASPDDEEAVRAAALLQLQRDGEERRRAEEERRRPHAERRVREDARLQEEKRIAREAHERRKEEKMRRRITRQLQQQQREEGRQAFSRLASPKATRQSSHALTVTVGDGGSSAASTLVSPARRGLLSPKPIVLPSQRAREAREEGQQPPLPLPAVTASDAAEPPAAEDERHAERARRRQQRKQRRLEGESGRRHPRASLRGSDGARSASSAEDLYFPDAADASLGLGAAHSLTARLRQEADWSAFNPSSGKITRLTPSTSAPLDDFDCTAVIEDELARYPDLVTGACSGGLLPKTWFAYHFLQGSALLERSLRGKDADAAAAALLAVFEFEETAEGRAARLKAAQKAEEAEREAQEDRDIRRAIERRGSLQAYETRVRETDGRRSSLAKRSRGGDGRDPRERGEHGADTAERRPRVATHADATSPPRPQLRLTQAPEAPLTPLASHLRPVADYEDAEEKTQMTGDADTAALWTSARGRLQFGSVPYAERDRREEAADAVLGAEMDARVAEALHEVERQRGERTLSNAAASFLPALAPPLTASPPPPRSAAAATARRSLPLSPSRRALSPRHSTDAVTAMRRPMLAPRSGSGGYADKRVSASTVLGALGSNGGGPAMKQTGFGAGLLLLARLPDHTRAAPVGELPFAKDAGTARARRGTALRALPRA